jgi:hypothetical protein
VWELLDARDDIDAGAMDEGCRTLERALGRGVRSSEVDTATLADRCSDHRIDEALARTPQLRRTALATLALSPMLDGAHRKRVLEELARLQGEQSSRGKPSMRAADPSVSGRLPPEVIQRIVRQSFARMKLCYENGLSSEPHLGGRITVDFVIDGDGNVASATAGASSDFPDKRVEQCVLGAFLSLTFPRPEGGIVRVSYPIEFRPD